MKDVKTYKEITCLYTKETQGNGDLYDNVMSNLHEISGKHYGNVPLKLFFIDERFQRTNYVSLNKLARLEANWDYKKMDPIRAVNHPETKRLSIVDGYHRLYVMHKKGYSHAPCEIINLGDIPKNERLLEEARLFVQQETEKVSATHAHAANVSLGVRENVILQKMMDKYNVTIKGNEARGAKGNVGEIKNVSQMLQDIRHSTIETVETVFQIICESGWRDHPYGFCGLIFYPLFRMLKLHPANSREIKDECVRSFREIDPRSFVIKACARYEGVHCSDRTKVGLYLEDYLCEKLNIPVLYVKNEQNIIRKPSVMSLKLA